MISENKISTLVSSQLPFFVRNDHENFVAFLEAYYEWMEQTQGVVNVAKSMKDQLDLDKTDIFVQQFYNNFLPLIPQNVLVDKNLLVKNIKDFYKSRGTEKSVRFLMRILFNDEVEFYYPKKDILRASDGKWFVEDSIKISDVYINGVLDNRIQTANLLVSRRVIGLTSEAAATVEKLDTYYESGVLVRELKISQQTKDFSSGEYISTTYLENGNEITIEALLFAGGISSVKIVSPGEGYQVGETVTITGDGSGAVVIISSVSTGSLSGIGVINGGSGFQNNSQVLVSGGGGSGANGLVNLVVDDGSIHPNSYNIVSSTISLESSSLLNKSSYTNLNSRNVNSTIASAMNYFTYANTGPIGSISLTNLGSNYTGTPTFSIVANTRVRALGILGRMQIINGGSGYSVGDILKFNNVLGGYGSGANARVKAVNTSSSSVITEVEFTASGGHIIGGSGYDQNFLPTVEVLSANGVNANIIVTSVLGFGERLASVGSKAGAILSLSITSRGSGYSTAPTLNLTNIGSGTAQATATVITGSYKYQGRFLNDDGMVSSYNFLQDRDYYQPFSYVLKLKHSLEKYKSILNKLIHPAGMKMFGEYVIEKDTTPINASLKNITVNVANLTIKVLMINTSTGTGNFVPNEVVYQGATLNTATFKASVVSWNNSTGKLELLDYIGTANTGTIRGVTSEANRTVITVV
jgi:hypothetical protein